MTKRRTMTTLTTIPTTEMSTDDYHDYENNEDNKSTTNMITTRVLEPSVLRRGGGGTSIPTIFAAQAPADMN